MRSRFMVTGLDLDRHRVRKFYLGCARQWLAPTELRIAEYAEAKLAGSNFVSADTVDATGSHGADASNANLARQT